MDSKLKNSVLFSLAELLEANRAKIMEANEADARAFPDMDESMMDRLKVDNNKIDGMIRSLNEVAAQADPEGSKIKELTEQLTEKGIEVLFCNVTGAHSSSLLHWLEILLRTHYEFILHIARQYQPAVGCFQHPAAA